FGEALAQVDLLFCNATEAAAVTGASGAAEAFAKLKGRGAAAGGRGGGHSARLGPAGGGGGGGALPGTAGGAGGARPHAGGGCLWRGLAGGGPPTGRRGGRAFWR